MAQVLVTESNKWYQGIASLKNYYEADLEDRILKHKNEVFKDYYSFKCKFTFENSVGETSDPDMLLISKNFDSWIIVELELGDKTLKHTKKQLRVFTKPKFNVNKLIDYCKRNAPELKGHISKLNALFSSIAPKVLVIYDYYDLKTFEILQKEFDPISICVFEIYNTKTDSFELYRFSGDYPFVTTDFSFLKERSDNYEIYEVQKPSLLDGLPEGYFEVLSKMRTLRVSLIIDKKGNYYLKLLNNPFPPGRTLVIYKTLEKKYILDII